MGGGIFLSVYRTAVGNANTSLKKKEGTMNRVQRVVAAIVVGVTLSPAALACWHFMAGPGSDGTEAAPCTGLCNLYWSCPGSDSCTSGHEYGSYTCSCSPIVVGCTAYSGGTPNPSGCCVGGVRRMTQPWPPKTATVTGCFASGDCWGYIFGGS